MRSRFIEFLLLLLVVFVWVLIRVLPAWPEVFPEEEETVLLGNDPWFHLHQLRGAVEHFPRLLRWDVGALYPEGSRVAAAGLFHLALATVARLVGIEATETARLAELLAWSPVVLGAASILLLFALAREMGGRRLAWATLALRVAFPGTELERTLLGFGDHHAAEILLATASLWAWVRWSRRFGSRSLHGNSAIGMAASLPVAVFLYTWIGAPLWALILSGAFWVAFLSALRRKESTGREARRFLPFFLSVPILTGITAILWPEGVMAPEALLITLTALGVQVLLVFAVAAGLRDSGSRSTRALVPVGLAIAALVATLSWFLADPSALRLAKSFLVPANAGIAEQVSIPFSRLWAEYGLVAPWVVFGWIEGIRRENPWPLRVVFWVIGMWGWLAFWRSDFFYLTGALFPLAAAKGMWSFFDLARRWQAAKPGGMGWDWLPGTCVAVTLVFLWPAGYLHPPLIRRDEVGSLVVATKPWRETMDWIRKETPAPPVSPTFLAEPWRKRDGFDYPEGTDAVFTHWQFGNLVCVMGDRIAVSARGRSGHFIDWFLNEDEASSHENLDRLGEVRYLVLDAVSVCDNFVAEALQAGVPAESIQVPDGAEWRGITLKSYGEPFRRSIGAQLYLGDGLSMERYRLVHESRENSFVRYCLLEPEEIVVLRSDLIGASDLDALGTLAEPGATWREEEGDLAYSGQILPSVKVFERVTGAVLEGLAAPGERVSVELPLIVTETGRELLYRCETEAGTDGRISFRVPHATEKKPGGKVHSVGLYRIRGEDGRESEIGVSEEQIRLGSVIRF